MIRPLLPLLAVACAAEEPPPPAPPAPVDLVVHGVFPWRLELAPSVDVGFRVAGENFCPKPLAILDGVEWATSASATSTGFPTFALHEMITRAQHRSTCDFAETVHLTVSCDGKAPPGPAGLSYGRSRDSVTFEAGVWERARTRVQAAVFPTSRLAGVALQVDGPLPTDAARFVDTGGVPADVVVDSSFGAETTRLEVWPKQPLAPGQVWTVTFDAGMRALHSGLRCLDFDGPQQVSIRAREDTEPVFLANIRLEGGTLVADSDEVGAGQYVLYAVRADLGHARYETVAFGSRPRLEWPTPPPGRYCSFVGAGPLESEKTCLDVP